MKKTIFVLMLSISFLAASKKEDIRYLLEITESSQMGLQVITNIINSLKKLSPKVPEQHWDSFSDKFEREIEDLLELLIPVYGKYYTEDEIKGMIEFYSSPLGKKIIEVSPLIVEESMAIGGSWGKAVGEKFYTELREKGYK